MLLHEKFVCVFKYFKELKQPFYQFYNNKHVVRLSSFMEYLFFYFYFYILSTIIATKDQRLVVKQKRKFEKCLSASSFSFCFLRSMQFNELKMSPVPPAILFCQIFRYYLLPLRETCFKILRTFIPEPQLQERIIHHPWSSNGFNVQTAASKLLIGLPKFNNW